MIRTRLIAGLVCATLSSVAAPAAFDPATGVITDERWRSGVPLGGIGAGAVEVLTDGALGNVTINHNWDRPTGILRGAFAAVRVKIGNWATARVLRRFLPAEYAGVEPVRHTRYLGLYPRAEVRFEDPDLPVEVSLHAWSPLIPNNVKDSALPVACLDYTVRNPGTDLAQVAVALAWPNLLGFGGRRDVDWDAKNGNRQTHAGTTSWRGLVFTTTQHYETMQQNTVGEYFLGAAAQEGVRITCCPQWDAGGDAVPWWSAFTERGELSPVKVGQFQGRPAGAVAAAVALAPGQARTLRFILTWHMPTFRMEHERLVPTDEVVERTDVGNAAFDGRPDTRWATGRGQREGDQFLLDLGAERTFSGLVLDSAPSPNDYPRGYLVEVSTDGVQWTPVASATPAQAEMAQKGAVLRIAFPPVTARHVRITDRGSDDSWFWSIHELQVLGPHGPLDLSGARAADRLVKVATHKVTEDVGSYPANFFPGAPAVAEYVAQNQERLLAQTVQWQQQVLESSLPFWLKLKLINCAFTMYSATVLARNGRFSVLESPVDMAGALGTMDQRMAAHAFYVQMFPELDRSELSLFALCQRPDGRITHFCGNIHQVLGNPQVGYGITDWPDLSCSWVMQVLKLYRWTGDRAWLEEMWPRIQRAMAWLQGADQDGDLIPEGGSTYDYETLPRGAFVYSASCYLGALLAAEAAGRTLGDLQTARAYRVRLNQVRHAVMDRLWNGQYLRKWRAGKGDEQNPNSFVAALAGDWLARLCGLEDTLAPGVLDQQVEQLIARHLKPFFPVPPMEVTADGRAATTVCFLLQHEPYLGCEAIYRGYVDDGLEVLRRVYYCAWELNKSPWDQSLVYDAPHGRQGGLRSYMTCPTSWHVLNALSGVTVDLPAQTLFISPRLPGNATELHLPVFLGTFWVWLDYAPGHGMLRLRVTRVHADTGAQITRVARDGNGPLLPLPTPFRITEGAVLDLSRNLRALAPYPTSRQVTWQLRPSRAPRLGLEATRWRVEAWAPGKAMAEEEVPALAVDGDPRTRWTTGRAMQPGDWFQVDLGTVRTVRGVWTDIAGSRRDYPRGYEVLGSLDGAHWFRLTEGDETQSRRCIYRGLWRATFPPTRVRYLRIVQRGSDSYWWWSIHELYVLPEGWKQPPLRDIRGGAL